VKKFRWNKDSYFGKSGPIYYLSNKTSNGLLHNKSFVFARVTSRNNGPNTAYAEFFKTIEWPTSKSQHWWYELSKHFKGPNAGNKAKAWCNFLLNSTPDYINEGKGHIDQWSIIDPAY